MKKADPAPKQVEAKVPAKAPAKGKAEAKLTIAEVTRKAILDGLPNDAVLEAIRKVHPNRSSLANINWYRMDLKRKGEKNVPGSAGASTKGAAKGAAKPETEVKAEAAQVRKTRAAKLQTAVKKIERKATKAARKAA